MPITDTNFITENQAKREQELAQMMKSVAEKGNVMPGRLAVVILAAGLGKRMKSACSAPGCLCCSQGG